MQFVCIDIELRMLLNINADKLQLLKVVLIGQPELKDLLAKPDMEQVTQRITSEAHLEPLLLNETKDYIKYRLTNAGGNAAIFSPEAIIHIHKASEGIPRVINILCDKGLVAAYGADSQAVTGDIMTEVIRGSRRAKSA